VNPIVEVLRWLMAISLYDLFMRPLDRCRKRLQVLLIMWKLIIKTYGGGSSEMEDDAIAHNAAACIGPYIVWDTKTSR